MINFIIFIKNIFFFLILTVLFYIHVGLQYNKANIQQLDYYQEVKRIAKQNRTKVNRNIRANEVRLIDPDGEQLGIIPIMHALAKAGDYGMDLVEISPNAKPPVCKIMDYGRFKYEETKKMQEAKKKQSSFQLKEIKLRPKTGEHDLNTKITHIKKFLTKKDKVKVTVMFRGREITLSQQGRDLLKKVAEETEELSVVELPPKFEGRTMIMILAPK